MNRRAFISGVAAITGLRAGEPQRELLMPSDSADDLGFRLMWYNPVSAIDQRSYRLAISGLIEKPQSLAIGDLRGLPQEAQSSRLKCVQCWSSRHWLDQFRLISGFLGERGNMHPSSHLRPRR